MSIKRNKANRLKRIIAIQDIVIEHKQKGITQEWVYQNVIYPRYFIGKRTFYEYLGTNAKAELKKLQ
ncbi:MAG: hypothetical protein JXB49_32360 [Bacteroidales bacterium]|nr:hypothetical protein [Bacteroidales bacterium]